MLVDVDTQWMTSNGFHLTYDPNREKIYFCPQTTNRRTRFHCWTVSMSVVCLTWWTLRSNTFFLNSNCKTKTSIIRCIEFQFNQNFAHLRQKCKLRFYTSMTRMFDVCHNKYFTSFTDHNLFGSLSTSLWYLQIFSNWFEFNYDAFFRWQQYSIGSVNNWNRSFGSIQFKVEVG